MTIPSATQPPGTAPSVATVQVIGGEIQVDRLDSGLRQLVVEDSSLREIAAARLGPGDGGRWTISREALYDLVHHLRISATSMPGRGAIAWPAEPAGFNLNTVWGRLGITVWPWGGVSIDIGKATDQAGVNAYMDKADDARWSDRYSNWVVGKARLDHLVIAHWAPTGAARVSMTAIRKDGRGLPPSRRAPAVVDGHPVITEVGRDDKIDKAWYKANGRWSRARCALGEYFVFDLHDSCKAVMTSYGDMHALLRDRLGARRFSPVNGYVLEAGSVPELNAAIAAAAGTSSQPGLRLV